MQAYSNPKKASDPWALPDLSIQLMPVISIVCSCGCYTVPNYGDAGNPVCPSCGKPIEQENFQAGGKFYFWCYCFPGCMPDSDWFGPFETAEEALADARENEDYEEDEE